MRLSYEITGNDTQLRRVLRGVESEAKAMNRRMGRDAQTAPLAQARRASVATTGRAEIAAAKALERQRLQGVKAEERAKLQADRNVARAGEQLDRQRARGLMQQFRTQEREQSRLSAQRERTAARIGTGAARSVGKGIGTVARIGGAAAGLIGGFSAAGALQEQMSISRKSSQLAISAGMPGEKKAIEKEALGVRGFTGSETLGAMSGFVEKTGDLNAARALIKDIGQLSLATSADFGEMGIAAGQAFNVIRDTIKDPKEQIKAVNDVMRTLAAQGNLGAVEIKDMATELAGLGAATRKFEGGPVELLKTVGAMAQAAVARGGAASAPEATTAVSRFAADITKQPGQKALNAMGVNVFADKGRTKLKGPEEVMLDILEKTQGDMVKVEEVLNAESAKALAGFSPLFIDAEKKQKGSGRQAVKQEFAKFKDAGLTDAQIGERAALRMSDPDVQITEVMKQFNAAIGGQLVPVLTQAIPKFAEAIPALANFTSSVARLAQWLLENPLKGVGLVVAGSVAKDVAAAGIGNLIKSLLGGGGGAGGAAVGKSGIGPGLAATAAIIGITAAVDQTQELAKASGGWSGVSAGIGGVLAGRGYAGGVDDYMNEQAKLDTYKKANPYGGNQPGGWFAPAPVQAAPVAGQRPGIAAPSVLPPELRQAIEANGADLRAAAQDLKAAAATIKKNAGPPEASRTAPIVSPSRG